jgi:hypothetical protein
MKHLTLTLTDERGTVLERWQGVEEWIQGNNPAIGKLLAGEEIFREVEKALNKKKVEVEA